MPELLVVGLSHRTAPVEVREKLAFPEDAIAPALKALGALPTIAEAMLISTCNRVEIYAATRDAAAPSAVAEVRQFLMGGRKIDGAQLYDRVGPEAVMHVFRVAASLDSLVVGEPQILGQLKSAFGAASEAGSVGPLLGRCLERAFGVAKRVRTETAIARGAANVSSVAVQLAHRVFGELDGKTVLVVGAGKMSALAARHLADDGADPILVTNRTAQRAEALAAAVGGAARPWADLHALLVAADVVVSSTGAREPILGRAAMKAVMKERRYRPLFIVDIAVPRDVDPEAGQLDGVYLFDIDDLERVVASNRKGREQESEVAERIVSSEAKQFLAWQRSQGAVPTIKKLRERFQSVAQAEVDKALAALGPRAEGSERVVRQLGDAIVAKLLHTPMMALKHDEAAELASAVERLFELSESEPEVPGRKEVKR
jgi:glutamyl-tRNA reductase